MHGNVLNYYAIWVFYIKVIILKREPSAAAISRFGENFPTSMAALRMGPKEQFTYCIRPLLNKSGRDIKNQLTGRFLFVS